MGGLERFHPGCGLAQHDWRRRSNLACFHLERLEVPVEKPHVSRIPVCNVSSHDAILLLL